MVVTGERKRRKDDLAYGEDSLKTEVGGTPCQSSGAMHPVDPQARAGNARNPADC